MANLRDDVDRYLADIDIMSINLESKIHKLDPSYDPCILSYLDSIVTIISRAISFCSIRIDIDSKK